MSYYFGFRFEGIVKGEFRKDFSGIFACNRWSVSSDNKFQEFSECKNSDCILCGLPLNWGDRKDIVSNYNKKSGHLKLQTCLTYSDNDVWYTFCKWEELLPYFIDTIVHYEVIWEMDVWSQCRGFKNKDGDRVVGVLKSGFKKYFPNSYEIL